MTGGFSKKDDARDDRRSLKFGCSNIWLFSVFREGKGKMKSTDPAILSHYISLYEEYVDVVPLVLRYRQAYFEIHGKIPPYPALPAARAWPDSRKGLSYKDKLTGMLKLKDGKGIELGPLHLPILSKKDTNVLYVDHLDKAGLEKKYTTIQGIVEVDRPLFDASLGEALAGDAPLDFLLASQVVDHIPDVIGFLKEGEKVLRPGGLVALSLPDRRMTFNFFREEAKASDIAAAYLEKDTIPNVKSVYDHYSNVRIVNMGHPASVHHDEVKAGMGAVRPIAANSDFMRHVESAMAGAYLDTHIWVFTPVSFLLAMADLAGHGYVGFRLKQFYPTAIEARDRDNHSFVAILEKATGAPVEELRRSYLMPLGNE